MTCDNSINYLDPCGALHVYVCLGCPGVTNRAGCHWHRFSLSVREKINISFLSPVLHVTFTHYAAWPCSARHLLSNPAYSPLWRDSRPPARQHSVKRDAWARLAGGGGNYGRRRGMYPKFSLNWWWESWNRRWSVGCCEWRCLEVRCREPATCSSVYLERQAKRQGSGWLAYITKLTVDGEFGCFVSVMATLLWNVLAQYQS